jgi:hypothetical protein
LKNLKVFCDMDGVLVDLRGGILDASRSQTKSMKDRVEKVIESEWKFGINHPDPQLQEANLYINDLVSNNLSFWAELSPTKEKDELWNFISQFNPSILSHPWDKDSALGKRVWLENHLSPFPEEIFLPLDGKKHRWAPSKHGEINILIDDFEKYVVPWNKAGGTCVHHKTGDAKSSIETIEKITKNY